MSGGGEKPFKHMRESVAGSFLLFPNTCQDAWEEGPCVCTDAWDEMLMHTGGSLGTMLEPFPPLPLSAWRILQLCYSWRLLALLPVVQTVLLVWLPPIMEASLCFAHACEACGSVLWHSYVEKAGYVQPCLATFI